MSHFKIVLAYDGTDYIGWQRQASGTSIQGLVEDALAELDGRAVNVAGAGRTDAGVHALGQVASFSLERTIDPATVVRSLNAKLPADVRVLSAEDAAPSFHARFDARSKTYRYRIWNAEVLNPFERRYVWHLVNRLDVDAMATAARLLEGTHDFAAFQGTGSDAATTVRTITRTSLQVTIDNSHVTIQRTSHNSPPTTGSAIHNPQSSMLEFLIAGDGFLRHMVRAIMGSLVEVGRGRQPATWIGEVLESRRRARGGQTAPAYGLALVSVDYGDALVAEP
jgi:tRNA pseudouridine38-40 synthase